MDKKILVIWPTYIRIEIDLMGDGGVTKHILEQGIGTKIHGGSEVSASIIGKNLHGIIKHDYVPFTLGIDNADGLQIGINSMKVGEHAILTCTSKYTQHVGLDKRIEPGETVMFEVKLKGSLDEETNTKNTKMKPIELHVSPRNAKKEDLLCKHVWRSPACQSQSVFTYPDGSVYHRISWYDLDMSEFPIQNANVSERIVTYLRSDEFKHRLESGEFFGEEVTVTGHVVKSKSIFKSIFKRKNSVAAPYVSVTSTSIPRELTLLPYGPTAGIKRNQSLWLGGCAKKHCRGGGDTFQLELTIQQGSNKNKNKNKNKISLTLTLKFKELSRKPIMHYYFVCSTSGSVSSSPAELPQKSVLEENSLSKVCDFAKDDIEVMKNLKYEYLHDIGNLSLTSFDNPPTTDCIALRQKYGILIERAMKQHNFDATAREYGFSKHMKSLLCIFYENYQGDKIEALHLLYTTATTFLSEQEQCAFKWAILSKYIDHVPIYSASSYNVAPAIILKGKGGGVHDKPTKNKNKKTQPTKVPRRTRAQERAYVHHPLC